MNREELLKLVEHGNETLSEFRQLIIQHNVNMKEIGTDILCRAAELGHLEWVKCLMEECAIVAIRDNHEQYPLFYAVQNGHENVIRYLAGKMSHLSDCEEILHEACKWGHLNIVQILVLEFKMDSNVKSDMDRTALHEAVFENHIDIVRFLVTRSGANVNVQDLFWCAPLHLAVMKNNIKIARFLLKHGADINNQGVLRYTPLHIAVSKRNLNMVRFLVNYGHANINIQDEYGSTPLHLIVESDESSSLSCCRYLVETCQADLTIKDCDNCTPATKALQYGYVPLVKYFIQREQTWFQLYQYSTYQMVWHHASKNQLKCLTLINKAGQTYRKLAFLMALFT